MSLIMEAMKRKDESAAQEDEELIEIEDVADILLFDDFGESTALEGPPLNERTLLGKVETEKQKFMETGKETKVNVQKLFTAVELLKNDLGDALLAADIFGSTDGQSIAGYNSQPKASALFGQLTLFLGKSLEGSGFPRLGKYYILDLADAKMVIVIPLGDYQWGLFVDTKKVQLGLLLNVVMPKIIDAFEEAIAG